MANRKEIEDRILQIISYIDQDNMLKPLVWSIKLFTLEELLQLKEFLETWDYKPIYILLDNKIKEYVKVKQEIKQINIWNKMKKVKENEEKEKKAEENEAENMLVF